jgi:alpha-tubulin suppressor-like RCC1 family protein
MSAESSRARKRDGSTSIGSARRGWGFASCAGLVSLLATIAACLTLATGAQAAAEAPVNVSPPTIGGAASEGSVLKAKNGEWRGGSLSYGYQWQRCEPECTNIPTATTSRYTARYVDIGTRLRVIVTASNSDGSAEAVSEETSEIAAVTPRIVEAPVISGAHEEGQLLTVSNGTWSGTPANSYSYQWERCNAAKHCDEIDGATESTYRASSEDVGDTLRVAVTATVSIVTPALSRTANSTPTPMIENGPPVALDLPAISGQLRVGGTLEAATGKWVGAQKISYVYSWQSCTIESSCSAVGSGSSYAVASSDVGHTIKLSITATNSRGTASSTSVPTPTVLGAGEDFAVAWGEDYRSQLGTTYRTMWEDRPMLVEGVSDVTALALGDSGSYQLHANGTISSEGASEFGTLGYGGRKATWEQGKSHVSVKGIDDATEVSAGGESGAALLADGAVVDWGNNGYGILGNGTGGFEKETGENQLEPKEVTKLNGLGVTSVVAGAATRYAILPGGRVDAWGNNHWGQLGVEWPTSCEKDGGCEPEYGYKHTRLLPGEPAHKCLTEVGWEICGKAPEPVISARGGAPLEDVKAVSAGAESAYALLENGEVLSWGNDGKGALGQSLEPGPHTGFTWPGKVMTGAGEPLQHVVAIDAGRTFVLALVEEEGHVHLVGWGADGAGALGAPTETCGHLNKKGGGKTWACDRYAARVSGPPGVEIAQIAASGDASAILGSDGKVYTIGSNGLGQLGRGPGCEQGGSEMGLYKPCYSTAWQAVPGLEHVQSIAAGQLDFGAVLAAGTAQPLPVIGHGSATHSVSLGWHLPDSETPQEIIYREWAHPGEEEVAESEGSEGGEPGELEEGEEPVEEGAGEPPKNGVLPGTGAFEVIEGEAVKVKTSVHVGDLLKGNAGTWSGTQPIGYEYQWLLCSSSKCSAIENATSTEFTIPNEEKYVGATIELQVTARNGVKPAGVADSAPTAVIKGEEEGRNAQATRVKVGDGLLLTGLAEEQYEVKLLSEQGKTRVLVVSPEP